jgi:hypothetical protein
MSRMLTSIFMSGSIGSFAFRYRYRIINVLLGSSWVRGIAVGSIMNMPGVKRKIMQSVFGGPSEW